MVPQLSSAIDYRRLLSLVTEKLYFPIADGCSTREGNAYKLWYSETRITINGVRVILASRLRYKVLHVDRRSERIMSISLVVDEETVNVISAYAPHVANPYSEVHGVFGYGVRNKEGHMILEFATAYNLVIVNSFFMKRDANLITFESEGRSTDINYIREVLVMSRILWKNLKYEAAEAYKIIIDEEKESLGVLVGTIRTHTTRRESRWLKEEVQTKLKVKQASYASKRKAYEELYKKLDSKEGANDIYRITNDRARRRRDIEGIRYIKDEGGQSIVNEEEIRKRWGEQYSSIFN
ncbi:retrovirus-related pol polyprotein LINE-1 [Tanacetum coccineum]